MLCSTPKRGVVDSSHRVLCLRAREPWGAVGSNQGEIDIPHDVFFLILAKGAVLLDTESNYLLERWLSLKLGCDKVISVTRKGKSCFANKNKKSSPPEAVNARPPSSSRGGPAMVFQPCVLPIAGEPRSGQGGAANSNVSILCGREAGHVEALFRASRRMRDIESVLFF
jgi:hypothetical protein